MENAYFQVLPTEVQQALGKAAFDAYVHMPPAFRFTGSWAACTPEFKARWLAVVESVMNQLQLLEEHVTTKMETFNQARRVLSDAIERFENIKPDDSMLNNYQLLEWLRSANAEVVNARLLMLRADIEAGLYQESGIETTQRVTIPNVRSE